MACGSCAQSHEIGCQRSDEIRCPRCCEITHRLVGTTVPTSAIWHLAGVNPIPASSGNTVRHRLNRGSDRRLNSALHMAAASRMTHDAKACDYVE